MDVTQRPDTHDAAGYLARLRDGDGEVVKFTAADDAHAGLAAYSVSSQLGLEVVYLPNRVIFHTD